jgi:sucrose porin
MKRKTLAVAVFTAIVASASTAPAFAAADDGIEFHGYAMVASDLKGAPYRVKNLALHMDPGGAHQDPRGKMGDLGNSYWHDMFTTLTMSKKWTDVGKEGQWADYNHEVVGYGDKGVETGQSYARMGGLDFLPDNAYLWAGRKNNGDRLSVFAYNIKEVNVDAGVGYVGDSFSATIGSNEISWGTAAINHENSNHVIDLEYRIDNSEFGFTYVKEDNNHGMPNWRTDGEVQQAISGYVQYNLDSYFGLASGTSMMEVQYGKGQLAQYLSTDRISSTSEEGDKSLRVTLDGNTTVEDVVIKSTLIYENTKREDDPTRVTFNPIGPDGFYNPTFGTAEESSIFAGVNVYQPMTENVAMVYEANYAHAQNKDGNDGMDGNMYKVAFGPALQLTTQPWAAPIASLTLTYRGGDKNMTFMDKDSELLLGFRVEAWF